MGLVLRQGLAIQVESLHSATPCVHTCIYGSHVHTHVYTAAAMMQKAVEENAKNWEAAPSGASGDEPKPEARV